MRDTGAMVWAQPGHRCSAMPHGAIRKESVMEMGVHIASSKGAPVSRLFSQETKHFRGP